MSRQDGYPRASRLRRALCLDIFSVSGYISGNAEAELVKAQRKAVTNFRRRLKQRGITRLEVNVRIADAAIVRDVVRALSNPEQEQAVRKLLREYFGSKPTRGLKDLLAAAPLEGIELKRDRDFGRGVDL